MFSKRLKYVAGVAAIALTGHAFASTTTTVGSGSTIFLTINDTTTGAGYVLDTGLSATSFNGNAAVAPITLSSAAYTAFTGSIGANDDVEYSLVGAEEPTAGVAPVTVDVTGLATPALVTNASVSGAYLEASNFLAGISNTAGADSYQTASSGTGWNAGGFEATLNGNIKDTDATTLGSALNFYQLTASGTSGHAAGTESTYAGTWLLSGNTLSYSGAAAVPLPAPLALLLSGLGLMSVVTRRRRAVEAA